MGETYWFRLEPTEAQRAYLETLPIGARMAAFERAINRALDHAGWPRGMRGAMAIPADYWYVIVTKDGMLRGHVGPIAEEHKALAAMTSWKTGGHKAKLQRFPIGPCLTNPHLP